MRPPIASPTGDVKLPLPLGVTTLSEALFVHFRDHAACRLRRSLKATAIEPFNILFSLAVTFVYTAILSPIFHTVTFGQMWTRGFCGFSFFCFLLNATIALCQSKRSRTVVLMRYGVLRTVRHKQVEIEWRRVLYVLNWSGDLFFCTLAGSTFVPRDAFASLEERREFVQIARELHKSSGAIWRAEWNGKTFGHDS